jgi:hypothetical protein
MRGERLPQWIDGDPELQRARLACGLFKQMDRLVVLAHTGMDRGDGRDLHILGPAKHEEFVPITRAFRNVVGASGFEPLTPAV